MALLMVRPWLTCEPVRSRQVLMSAYCSAAASRIASKASRRSFKLCGLGEVLQFARLDLGAVLGVFEVVHVARALQRPPASRPIDLRIPLKDAAS